MDKATTAWINAMQGGGSDHMMYHALRWRLDRRRRAPKHLFHYTSLDALHEILNTGRVWASDIRFANDRREVSFAGELARETLRLKSDELLDKGDKSSALSWAMRYTVQHFESLLPAQNFVVSMTPERDDLSQWRGYGGEYGAVAIGFDVSRLSRSMERHAFHLLKVEYDRRSIDKQLSILAWEYASLASALLDVDDDEESVQKMMTNRYGVAVGAIAPVLKDDSFRAESEWRFVGSGDFLFSENNEAKQNARRLYAVADLGLGFRKGARYPIPYVSVPISNQSGDSSIVEVVLGPTPDPATTRLACRQLLDHFGLTSCALAESSVPYRDW